MRYLLALTMMLSLGLLGALAQDEEDTPKAAKQRKLLKTKITVAFKEAPLFEVQEELQETVKGLSIRLDTAGGVSRNLRVSFTGKDKTVEEVFAGMFVKNGLGYIVISKKGNAYDGTILIKQGKERGSPIKK